MKKTILFFGCSISLFTLMMLFIFTGCNKTKTPQISGFTLPIPSLLLDINRQSKDSLVSQFTKQLRSNLMAGMDTKQLIADTETFENQKGNFDKMEEGLNEDNSAIYSSSEPCFSQECLFPVYYMQNRVGDPCKGGKCYEFSLIRRLACRFDAPITVIIRDMQGNVVLESLPGNNKELSNGKLRFIDLSSLNKGQEFRLDIINGSVRHRANFTT